uniref:Uncharacterized protein n=1 Tax=Odontella aurita TaxID=265563 RepID=A0A6U6ELM7_9STRA|mmetsp:Transcript_28078/g.82610  ORF Transcript_28078/g.82610 Transcript_28078/m.82610 type:complete len:213 (+) Transcript_28078:31-669(+)
MKLLVFLTKRCRLHSQTQSNIKKTSLQKCESNLHNKVSSLNYSSNMQKIIRFFALASFLVFPGFSLAQKPSDRTSKGHASGIRSSISRSNSQKSLLRGGIDAQHFKEQDEINVQPAMTIDSYRTGAETYVEQSARSLQDFGNNATATDSTENDSDSSVLDKAKEHVGEAKDQIDEVINTAPNEWTKGQKIGVGVGVTAAVLILLCCIKKCFC